MSMDHARAASLQEDYFRGRLDRATVRELHEHLKACEECRSRVRLRRAGADAEREGRIGRGARDADMDAIQARIVGNRNLLIQILLLLVFAWFVWRMKR